MNIEYKDFIGIYSNVYPEGYCEHLISEFERLIASGAGTDRQRGEGALKHCKDDVSLDFNFGVHTALPFNDVPPLDVFFRGLQQCYDDYTEQYSILKEGKIAGTAMKMQRTKPGGGYHLWHAEQGNGAHAERVLVYMLYLNTLEKDEAGETEFLYQKQRYSPTKNQMLIWPAAYTHCHRGNPVIGSKDKYIVTGWFYYD